MKITYITAAYNRADTIGSVATQSYSDYEHLMMDGASADGSLGAIDDQLDQ